MMQMLQDIEASRTICSSCGELLNDAGRELGDWVIHCNRYIPVGNRDIQEKYLKGEIVKKRKKK